MQTHILLYVNCKQPDDHVIYNIDADLEEGVGAHGDDIEGQVELGDVEEGAVVGGVHVLPLPHLHEAHLLPLLRDAEQAHIVLTQNVTIVKICLTRLNHTTTFSLTPSYAHRYVRNGGHLTRYNCSINELFFQVTHNICITFTEAFFYNVFRATRYKTTSLPVALNQARRIDTWSRFYLYAIYKLVLYISETITMHYIVTKAEQFMNKAYINHSRLFLCGIFQRKM